MNWLERNLIDKYPSLFKKKVDREVFSEEFEWYLERRSYHKTYVDMKKNIYIRAHVVEPTGRWKIDKFQSGISYLYLEVIDMDMGSSDTRTVWVAASQLTIISKPKVYINNCKCGE